MVEPCNVSFRSNDFGIPWEIYDEEEERGVREQRMEM